ncbi:MAG: zinc ribbon domain-containing protein [Rhodospirillum sp.]|nr:zinc ribbon domain-containing protein [Rhodospirillum sp.]MCF8491071.1 zinc ribbon domain-containing protein [Rhodospirillum sp.]MCF8500215.1 zinc ribbon domain-containing protein [Rhodospirillum sp.]
MPLYSYHCKSCSDEFEQLVGSGETPTCPKCQSTDLARMLGSIAPMGKMKGFINEGRAQAAKEGHFSNYSKSELKGKL